MAQCHDATTPMDMLNNLLEKSIFRKDCGQPDHRVYPDSLEVFFLPYHKFSIWIAVFTEMAQCHDATTPMDMLNNLLETSIFRKDCGQPDHRVYPDSLAVFFLLFFMILVPKEYRTFIVNSKLDSNYFFLISVYYQFSTCFEQPSAHHQESQLYQYDITITLALQPWVSLGLLNNPPSFMSILHRLHPLLYPHCLQFCYHIVHPSQMGSSFSSSYKQSSFHHLSWHRSLFHSLYMSQPGHLHTVTYIRGRFDTIDCPDDEHLVARNM